MHCKRQNCSFISNKIFCQASFQTLPKTKSVLIFFKFAVWFWCYLFASVMESKTVLDYKSHSMDSIFQSFSVELGFWIPFLSGIPDSLSCILGSKGQDSGFNQQNVPGFRILQANISHIPKSGSPYVERYLYLLFIFLSRYFLYFSQFGGGFHRLNFDKFRDTALLSGRDFSYLSSPLPLA